MSQIVLNGNNIELLKNYPDNYFDAVVTDPPYGLGKEPIAEEVMRDWVEKGYHEVKGSGFMGKEWDAFIPQPIFWKEVFRVLKHGGHVVSFFGTRTYDWGVMAMRFAGFEVRDCIQWLYGSGFPKSYNIAKGIEGKIVNGSSSWNDWKKLDGEKEQVNWGYSKSQSEQGYRGDYTEANKERVGKVNFQSDEAKAWEGWGSALKPANEPIVLARKPLEKGLSIAENVLKWGTGGINIDGCRVSSSEDMSNIKAFGSMPTNKSDSIGFSRPWMNDRESILEKQNAALDKMKNLGRFPANLILTHHPECECKGLKKIKGQIDKPTNRTKFDGTWNEDTTGFKKNINNIRLKEGFADENGEETIEDWECHENCPIRIMDEQSGVSKSPNTYTRKSDGFSIGNSYQKNVGEKIGIESKNFGDSGGASRFFYVAKASKSERNKGLEGFDEKQSVGCGGGIGDYIEDVNSASGKYGSEKAPNKNFHPTVKPIKLMQYLARLITPPNGIVLDPFCGSGTTGIACKLEGFEFVGMEQDPEYTKIAQARIENYKEGKEELKVIQTKANEQHQLTLFKK
jgi:DNA modification methylase